MAAVLAYIRPLWNVMWKKNWMGRQDVWLEVGVKMSFMKKNIALGCEQRGGIKWKSNTNYQSASEIFYCPRAQNDRHVSAGC